MSSLPELGAKISLISKADIRYEGRLFQVDPTECTIALSNVRSFGTEDRETLYPVPAQNQVYEYILFRGSDIKDIRIVPTIPQDPAIVQSVPLSQPPASQPAQPNFPAPGLGHSVLGQTMHPLGGFGGYGAGGLGGLGGLNRAPGPLMMQQPSELGPVARPHEVPPPQEQVSVVELMGGASRSTTPSLTRKSPTMDQGTQVSKSPPRDMANANKHPRPIQPPERDNQGRRDNQSVQQFQQFQQGGYRQRDNYGQRDGGDGYDNRDNRRPFHENNRMQADRGDFQRNDNRRPNNFRRDYRDPDQQFQNRNYQPRQNDGGWQGRQNQNQNQNQGQNNQNMQNRMGGPSRGRSRGNGRFMNNRSGTPQANKKNPLKFDDEYDFDKYNNEFEELRTELNKIKITAEEAIPSEAVKETEKKEDSGNETGTAETDADQEVFYDKKKSFFDCISCEAVERSKGRSQRTDWRKERQLNTETFGVSSARRGMYRRGYYHNNRGYGYRPRNNTNGGPDAPAAPAAPAVPEPLMKKTVESVVAAAAAAAPASPPVPPPASMLPVL